MSRLSDTINIGVSDIYWYPAGSEIPVYLGLTKDGATVKYETNWHEITADQIGSTALDDVSIGESIVAEVKVLNTSKSHIAAIMPTATAEGSNTSAVTFGRRPGLRASHYAGKLVMHPVSMGDDHSQDVIIYRTVNTGSLELAFKLDSEWVIPCVFKGYYDDYRQPGDQLFRIGIDNGSDTVYKRVLQFWITPSNPQASVGETISFTANAMYEDGTTADVTSQCQWSSSVDAVVTLSGTTPKMAKAVAVGTSLISATFIGTKSSTTMEVS